MLQYLDAGGKQRRETDGTVIYIGDGGGGMFNTPYFDQEMQTNYTVQVNRMNEYEICINFTFKNNEFCPLTFLIWLLSKKIK